jgi:DNA-binding transcriptional regulator YiaG
VTSCVVSPSGGLSVTETSELERTVKERFGSAKRPDVYDRQLREQGFGLSKVEAAAALGKSASTLENWELLVARYEKASATDKKSISLSVVMERPEASKLLEAYVKKKKRPTADNLLFGVYPLRVGREILEKTLDQIAAKYGYKPDTWKKMEANIRPLDKKILGQIEDEMRDHLAKRCQIKIATR